MTCKMFTKIKYSNLPVNTEENQSIKKFSLLKISRFKFISVIVISLTALVFIGFSCVRWNTFNHSQICNINQKGPTIASAVQEKGHFRIPHTKRRLPQCIIIGVRKAGTRALLTYLNIHPDVVTVGKEMHFFEDDDFYNESNGLEAYRKSMPFTFEGQITIEKTPAYFTEPEVPMRIYRMNQTIRLLLLLRDPVERSHSDYLQIARRSLSKNKKFPSFEQNCLDKNGRINKSYKAISRSVYHRHLSRWLNLFKREQIHIIDSAVLVKDPYSAMRQVETFLGLAHKIKQKNFYFNKTKGFYCIQTEKRDKCLTESKGVYHPEIDSEVLHKLRRYFAPHNQKLYKMIGRQFYWDEE